MLRTNEVISTLPSNTCMAYTGTTLLSSHISFWNVSWNSTWEKFLSYIVKQFQLSNKNQFVGPLYIRPWIEFCVQPTFFKIGLLQETLTKVFWKIRLLDIINHNKACFATWICFQFIPQIFYWFYWNFVIDFRWILFNNFLSKLN
jgi:hypothetical protein